MLYQTSVWVGQYCQHVTATSLFCQMTLSSTECIRYDTALNSNVTLFPTLCSENISLDSRFAAGYAVWDILIYYPLVSPLVKIHDSIYILIRSNKMQQYAGIYLLQNQSTCLGCPSHPSSGVHKTVTAASGTDHNIWARTFLQRGQIWPRWRKLFAQNLWPVPDSAVTVLRTPDDGCDGHPKHAEWFCSK